MDDIVAVAVELEDGAQRYFLTWGRLFDRVDGTTLESVVLENAHRFALGGVALRARVCDSLQEAAGERYFYESLFDMAQKPIPFGDAYESWRQTAANSLTEGRGLWYLGVPKEPISRQ
jgi:hypothetical protein